MRSGLVFERYSGRPNVFDKDVVATLISSKFGWESMQD